MYDYQPYTSRNCNFSVIVEFRLCSAERFELGSRLLTKRGKFECCVCRSRISNVYIVWNQSAVLNRSNVIINNRIGKFAFKNNLF